MSTFSSTVRPPPLALLVEDDSDTRQMYAEWLGHSGFRVAEASTASEAIEIAQRLHPHVIATDIGLLGDVDGCVLCERLRSDFRTRSIPIIAVTAWAFGGHVERARRAGCDSVLIKPCLPKELLAEIQRLLGRTLTNTPSAIVRSLLGTLRTEAESGAHRSPALTRRRDALLAVLEPLITALPVAGFVADDAGSYMLANRRASEVTGYSADELLRLSVWHLTPAMNEREAETLWRAFLQQGEQSGDYQLLTKNGQIVRAAYAAHAHLLPRMHVSLLEPL